MVSVILVIATHIAERLDVFPSAGWGLPDSPGHYPDLASAEAALLLTADRLRASQDFQTSDFPL